MPRMTCTYTVYHDGSRGNVKDTGMNFFKLYVRDRSHIDLLVKQFKVSFTNIA